MSIVVLGSVTAFTCPVAALAQESMFSLMAPSIVLSAGGRFQKAPNDDTLDRGTGGFKIAPISMQFAGMGHVSFLAPGIFYVGANRVAGVLSPVIIGHTSGLGISVDFYTIRDDDPTQRGGTFGVSLNLDVMALQRFVSRVM